MRFLKVDKGSFVEMCANRIIEVTKVRDAVFEPYDENTKLSYFLFSPTGETRLYDDRKISTINLGNDLWMGFDITWHDPKSTARNVRHCLRSINMKFYHKELLICRAEWDCENEKGSIITHPQPHWHFAKNSPTIAGTVPAQNGFANYAQNGETGNQIVRFGEVANQGVQAAQPEQDENADTDNFDIVRIHFATSSRWPENIAENREPQKNEIISWFIHCIESMKEQHGSHYTKKPE